MAGQGEGFDVVGLGSLQECSPEAIPVSVPFNSNPLAFSPSLRRSAVVKLLNVYAEFAEKYMAVPVVKGVKSANERFAGALNTYTCLLYTSDRESYRYLDRMEPPVACARFSAGIWCQTKFSIPD